MHRKEASVSKLRKFSLQKITIAKNKTASINHIIIHLSLAIYQYIIAISVRKRKMSLSSGSMPSNVLM